MEHINAISGMDSFNALLVFLAICVVCASVCFAWAVLMSALTTQSIPQCHVKDDVHNEECECGECEGDGTVFFDHAWTAWITCATSEVEAKAGVTQTRTCSICGFRMFHRSGKFVP